MVLLNCKNISSDEKVVIWTHPLLQESRRKASYVEQLRELSKIGKIIIIESPEGYYTKYSSYGIKLDCIGQLRQLFTSFFWSNPYRHYILKKTSSKTGYINLEEVLPYIRDKQLYFAGGYLTKCLFNTIACIMPIVKEVKHSMTFTLLKDYIWTNVNFYPGFISEQTKQLIRDTNSVVPKWNLAPELIDLIETEFVTRHDYLDRRGINCSFTYNDYRYTLNYNPNNNLAVRLAME